MLTRPWNDRPVIMGIINANPDSLYEESIASDVSEAVAEAESMIAHGAVIIDLGAEGSGEKSEPVDPKTEIQRLRPYVEALSDLDVILSIDTHKSQVADEMLSEGADMINDPSGLDDPKMKKVVAKHECPVVINHCIEPMVTEENRDHDYEDIQEVTEYLAARSEEAIDAGVNPENILVDPGFGFQKPPEFNLQIVKRFEELQKLGFPILCGPSRKPEFIDHRADDLLPLTLALTAVTVQKGADVVRVHDVPENMDALEIGYIARND